MKIIKNIIKNELYLLGFIAFQEILRLLMKAGEYLAIDIKIMLIMLVIVAILSVLQQIIKDTYIKKQDNSNRI